MSGDDRDALVWAAAERQETWAAEVRVNLLRLVLIAAFYGHHLITYEFFRGDLTPRFHLLATGIAAAWATAALGIQWALVRRWNPPALKYAALLVDAVMVLTVLMITDGPKSTMLVLPFLLVGASALRLNLRYVYVATFAAIAIYATTLGVARWGRPPRPEWAVPRTRQVIYVLGLAGAGLLAGQAVRQARRFARDVGERMKPAETK